ncbi:hypothetical protein DPMN_020128 [Dreissena polymorpha]|uniref:Uncharacterized protein n=1 Tax=Dreissena polymorpha TaxID=45954 RepID=A0A9D4NLM0_DREPO|nr:hypothetical protein DPMN_020128 [Dreissena polymorpha]
MLKVNPSGFVTSHSNPKQPGIESALEKALKNDSSFVVWSSMPFGSQPDVR